MTNEQRIQANAAKGYILVASFDGWEIYKKQNEAGGWLEIAWISLKQELPNPGEPVFWYDAMFDNIMFFALDNPGTHDGDFTHFARLIPTRRPTEYDKDEPIKFYTTKKR